VPAAGNKHGIKWRRLFEANMWPDDDTAFCHARFCVDTSRYHSVTRQFTRFRLVPFSNSRARKDFSGTHEVSRGCFFGYNQTNRLWIHGCSDRLSQLLDRGLVYNDQSARFDKSTLRSAKPKITGPIGEKVIL